MLARRVLGWVAGDIFSSDPVVPELLSRFDPTSIDFVARVASALLVLGGGAIWRMTAQASGQAEPS